MAMIGKNKPKNTSHRPKFPSRRLERNFAEPNGALRDAPGESTRWEEFAVSRVPAMNVITCLQEIQKHPVDAAGHAAAAGVGQSGGDGACGSGGGGPDVNRRSTKG